MNKYYSKYLLYKNKYYNLKNQKGGFDITEGRIKNDLKDLDDNGINYKYENNVLNYQDFKINIPEHYPFEHPIIFQNEKEYIELNINNRNWSTAKNLLDIIKMIDEKLNESESEPEKQRIAAEKEKEKVEEDKKKAEEREKQRKEAEERAKQWKESFQGDYCARLIHFIENIFEPTIIDANSIIKLRDEKNEYKDKSLFEFNSLYSPYDIDNFVKYFEYMNRKYELKNFVISNILLSYKKGEIKTMKDLYDKYKKCKEGSDNERLNKEREQKEAEEREKQAEEARIAAEKKKAEEEKKNAEENEVVDNRELKILLIGEYSELHKNLKSNKKMEIILLNSNENKENLISTTENIIIYQYYLKLDDFLKLSYFNKYFDIIVSNDDNENKSLIKENGEIKSREFESQDKDIEILLEILK